MPLPDPPEELARQANAMGPVAYIPGPLSAEEADTIASVIEGEARNVKQYKVDHFRMQAIDVGPRRRVIMLEIEYVWEDPA